MITVKIIKGAVYKRNIALEAVKLYLISATAILLM